VLKVVTMYIEIFPRDSSSEEIVKSETENGNKFHVVLNQTRILLGKEKTCIAQFSIQFFLSFHSTTFFCAATLLLSRKQKSIVRGNNSPVLKDKKISENVIFSSSLSGFYGADFYFYSFCYSLHNPIEM
jgi:hypothetical protein